MHAAELWHQLGAIDRLAAALAGLAFGATLLAALWELVGTHRARTAVHLGISRRKSCAPTRSPDGTGPRPRCSRRHGVALLATLAIAGGLPLVLLLR